MKRLLIYSSALLLSACSTHSQLSVVDNLTMVSDNEGVALNPSRWFISHPLQTTYVSLNGQLALKAGQICIASKYRSPFTNNCREIDKVKKFYSEYYPSQVDSTDVKNGLKVFLDAIYAEQQAQIEYVAQTTQYYTCITKENAKVAQQEGTVDITDKDVLEKTKAQIPLACESEQQAVTKALKTLQDKQALVQQQSSIANRIVYNWAKSFKFEGGAVVSTSNSAANNLSKEASGYTVVSGLHIDRYQLTCKDLRQLTKEYGDTDRLKIVTLTLSADELYYNAREYKAAAFNVNLAFTPKSLTVLRNVLGSEANTKVKLALANASNLASSGYLTTPVVERDTSKTSSQGLTYYAVLTDLKSLESSCSK